MTQETKQANAIRKTSWAWLQSDVAKHAFWTAVFFFLAAGHVDLWLDCRAQAENALIGSAYSTMAGRAAPIALGFSLIFLMQLYSLFRALKQRTRGGPNKMNPAYDSSRR